MTEEIWVVITKTPGEYIVGRAVDIDFNGGFIQFEEPAIMRIAGGPSISFSSFKVIEAVLYVNFRDAYGISKLKSEYVTTYNQWLRLQSETPNA